MKTKLFKVAEEIRKHRDTILFVDAIDACEEVSFCLPPAHTATDVAALIAHMEAYGFRECETDAIVVKLTDGIMLYGDHLATYGGENCGDNKNYVLADDFLGIVGEYTTVREAIETALTLNVNVFNYRGETVLDIDAARLK